MSSAPDSPPDSRDSDPEGRTVRRLLLVTGKVSDESFGHAVLRLAGELRRRGTEVALLGGNGTLWGEPGDAAAEPALANGAHPRARPPRRVLDRVRALGPDLIHLFGRRLAAWGATLAAAAGCPYVLTILGPPSGRRPRLRGDWTRGSVLAISEELREQLVNRCHVPKSVVGVIPLGIALDDYERYRGAQRSDRVPVVGMVGALTRERGGEVFLRAAKRIVEGGHDAQFLLAGDGPERDRLRRLAQQLGIAHCTTMVRRFSDYREMIGVLDICVIPALAEGLGLNVIEAMACRKPVVATGIGSVYSVIADGETGLLAPRGDDRALAHKLLRLIEDRDLARRIADAAYEQMRERFSVHGTIERLLAFYSECLARAESR